MNLIDRDDITGLVLAGGRGSRMSGADKGLQNVKGIPMAMHTLLHLQMQVGRTMINANRNLSAYEAMGVPVWPDSIEGYIGPLAGILAGLERAETGWMITVPCDTPWFPVDLVERLADAAATAGASMAMAATSQEGPPRLQPGFCLLRVNLVESLVSFLHAGERDLEKWGAQEGAILVPFEDAEKFRGADTVEELRQLHNFRMF